MAKYSTLELSMILIASLLFTGCYLSHSEVRLISDQIPPTFKFSGMDEVKFIRMVGPYPVNLSPNYEAKVIWQINRVGEYQRLSELPPITYGTIPAGWEQEVPPTNTPLPLAEGSVYSLYAVTRLNHTIKTCMIVKNGKAEEFHDLDLCKQDN